MSKQLILALSKGRILEETLPLLADAGITPAEDLSKSRKLLFDTNLPDVKLVIIRATDVPTYVQLGAADVGIAMGGGTDVALETADAALLKNRVTGIAELIDLSRATLRNVKTNVVLALGLKAIFLVTTALGITGMWIAVMADTGATVLVTLNAMRLLGYRFSPSTALTGLSQGKTTS